jgi:stage II sporulation protein D
VRPPAPDAPSVRVGLLVDTTRVEISAPGRLEVVAAGSGEVLRRVPAGERVAVVSDPSGGLTVRDAAGAEIARAASGPLLFRTGSPAAGTDLVHVGGKPYRGHALVQARPGGKVTAVNVLDMERYLLGVVPREIGRVGEELHQASKAQAVAARTYAVKYLGRRAPLGFDVFATVQDQVYGGTEAEHAPVSRAVLETAGEILTHGGEPIEAYYHSTCAGQTAAIEEVWPQQPVPYLKSVVDTDPATGEAYDRASSRFRWTQRWRADSLVMTLRRTLADSVAVGGTRRGSAITEIRDMQVLERTHSGRVRRMRISTDAGDFIVGRDRVRWVLEVRPGVILNSSKFDVEVARDPATKKVTEVVATGGGWGHGIGMCQVGAMGRARAGQDYRTILKTYYPATELRDLY